LASGEIILKNGNTPSIQRVFLPKRHLQRISGIEVFFIWESAEDVGGDYFFTDRFGQNLGIEIGDVMGHGVNAALSMTALSGVFFSLREFSLPLQHRVSIANRFLCRLAATDRAVTSSMFVAEINLESGLITYINAGHPYPLYFSASSEDPIVLPLSTGGMILGFIEHAEFETGQLMAEPDDFMVLFTDGFSEAFNGSREEYAKKHDLRRILLECANLSAEKIVQKLKNLVDDFREGVKFEDDFTLVAVKFTDHFRPRRFLR
jgi:sigma-B regulation protein RsbU (phosphoserine phosphatase)